MTWDDFERVLCYCVYVAGWSSPLDAFDWDEMSNMQRAYIERWPR